MKILDFLRTRNVFDIRPHGDKFEVVEQCDGWYCVELTKEQMLQLAEEIKELAETLG